jgi:hypothetical protein
MRCPGRGIPTRKEGEFMIFRSSGVSINQKRWLKLVWMAPRSPTHPPERFGVRERRSCASSPEWEKERGRRAKRMSGEIGREVMEAPVVGGSFRDQYHKT